MRELIVKQKNISTKDTLNVMLLSFQSCFYGRSVLCAGNPVDFVDLRCKIIAPRDMTVLEQFHGISSLKSSPIELMNGKVFL